MKKSFLNRIAKIKLRRRTMMRAANAKRSSVSLLLILCLVGFESVSFAQKVKMEEGTQVRLRLMESISSASAQAGHAVTFEVLDDVKVEDTIVIAEGASAWGT